MPPSPPDRPEPCPGVPVFFFYFDDILRRWPEPIISVARIRHEFMGDDRERWIYGHRRKPGDTSMDGPGDQFLNDSILVKTYANPDEAPSIYSLPPHGF